MDFPHDIEAERVVCGVVAQSPHAFAFVADLLEPSDFYDARHARIWTVAAQLTDVPALIDWDQEAGTIDFNVRVGIVAEAAGVSPSYVAELEAATPVMHNAAPWARRVAASARRRKAMFALKDAYNALGDGATLDDVRADLDPLLREAS